jgi:uncharacterized protein YqeY
MLEDRLASDFKESMKNRDQARTQTLSFLRSELKYAAIDKKKDKLDDVDVISVIKKLIKQRQDGILQFEKGQRMDLVAKEKAELELLKTYLPAEMSESQLVALVDEVVASTGATSVKDMGRVIKEVVARAEGQADGKTVSDLVKKKLSSVS